jgi:hypothetical protein
MVLRIAALAASALALTACATGQSNDGADARPQGFADYQGDPRLGERVDRICFGSQINSFGETTDETVLLESGVNDWYLVHTFSCPDLDFARSLSFDRYGSCLRQSDAVIAYRSFTGPDRSQPEPLGCRIRAIYEWDPGATADGAAE